MLLSITLHAYLTYEQLQTSMEPTLQCAKCIVTIFPQISKIIMHKAVNEVGLLAALYKKLIKWKFQVQGEDLNKTHLLHHMLSV